jgi:protein phosphatase
MERSENQDYYGYYEPEDDRDFDLQGRLIIVCDGMGGHAGGEVASRLAVNTLIETYKGDRSGDTPAALRRAVEAANRAIWDHAAQKTELKGMGSTCVSMVIRGGQAVFGHVGDSRCYLIRNEQLLQVTKDHSLVQQMVDEGLLQESEMESHPEKNVILRSLGVKQDVEVEVNAMPYQIDDIFILSTDGLTGLVSKEECRRIALLNKDNPMEGARLLVDLANKYGGYDNVTVQIARVRAMSPGEAPKPAPKDSNTSLFTQEDVQRSIAEARKKAQDAAKAGPSAAEMQGNVAKKPAPQKGVTQMASAPTKDELEKAKAELAAQGRLAPQKSAAPAAKAAAGGGGGSSKLLGVAVVVALLAMGGLVFIMLQNNRIPPLLMRLAAVREKARPMSDTKEYKAADKKAADAIEKTSGFLGFTHKEELDDAIKAFEQIAPAGKTSSATSGDADKARRLAAESRQLAFDAGAAQLSPLDWEAAEKSLADAKGAADAGLFSDALDAYAHAENAFRHAADSARERQAEKDLGEKRSLAQRAKEDAARYAKDDFPELMKEANDALADADVIQKTSATRALEKVTYAYGILLGINRAALDIEKKN